MEMKYLLNNWIDSLFEKDHKKKEWKPLTNKDLAKGLETGKLFIGFLVGKDNDPVSKGIRDLSGPFTHMFVTGDIDQYTIEIDEMKRLQEKLDEYYKSPTYYEDYNAGFKFSYLVLASADDNGMNYFDLSVYQDREMILFDITNDFSDLIIREFLKEEIMDANYDYTWIFGQAIKYIIFKVGNGIPFLRKSMIKLGTKIVKFFDDKRAWGCSKQEELFRLHATVVSDKKEPSPTESYKYCKKHYKVVYSNLKKKY